LEKKNIWVGTGENNYKPHFFAGLVHYKGTVGSKTIGFIAALVKRIILEELFLDEDNPTMFTLAVTRSLYRRIKSAGIFKTTDAGRRGNKLWRCND